MFLPKKFANNYVNTLFLVLAVEKDLELVTEKSSDMQISNVLLLIKPGYVCITRHCQSSKQFC